MSASTAIASSAPYRALIVATARVLDILEAIAFLATCAIRQVPAVIRFAVRALPWIPWLLICMVATMWISA